MTDILCLLSYVILFFPEQQFLAGPFFYAYFL